MALLYVQVIHRDLKLENILLKSTTAATQEANLAVSTVFAASVHTCNRRRRILTLDVAMASNWALAVWWQERGGKDGVR